MDLLASLAPYIIAILGPLGTYLVAVRRLSGKIGSSDATALWTESSNIRADYREQLERSDRKVKELEAKLSKQEEKVDNLDARIVKFETDNYKLLLENGTLRTEKENLVGQLDVLKLTITELEDIVHNQRDRLGERSENEG